MVVTGKYEIGGKNQGDGSGVENWIGLWSTCGIYASTALAFHMALERGIGLPCTL